jgi:uncharacterized membrane protein YtjA (UPF0391 family)
MLFTILIVLLVLSLLGGGWGYSRYGYAAVSPLGILLVLFLILYFTGHVRFG